MENLMLPFLDTPPTLNQVSYENLIPPEVLRESLRRLKLQIREELRPKPKLLTSDWALKHRIIGPPDATERAPWTHDGFEYLIEFMNCFDDPKIKTISVMKSSQTGFTQGFTNMIGKSIHLKPGPIGVFYPTESGVKKFSKRKFDQMLRDTEVLFGKIEDARKRKGDNSVMEKSFPDGFISMSGLGSPNNAASQTLRDIYLDEADRLAFDVGGEGDTITLLKMRQENFEDSKLVIVSTPTMAGLSIIEKSYNLSDKRKRYVPCPNCGTMQVLDFFKLKGWRIKEGVYEPEAVYYECENPKCKYHIEERKKFWMGKNGEWIKTNPKVLDHAGFQINSLYSPLPKASWTNIVKQWIEYLDSGKDQLKLKSFYNVRLGITWEDKTAHRFTDEHILHLLKRREHFGLVNEQDPLSEILIPKEVAVLVFGADVQDDRIELKLKGVGLGEESYNLDYKVFPGDTTTNKPFDLMDAYLLTRFKHAFGLEISILAGCIDSRNSPQKVIEWASKYAGYVYAIHGIEGIGEPIFNPGAVQVKWGKSYRIGTFNAKKTFFSRLAIENHGSGYIHHPFRMGDYPVDEDYFKSLTAEVLVNDGKKEFWKKIRSRNEALDTEIYAWAAYYSLRLDQQQIKNILESFESVGTNKPEPPKETNPPGENYALKGLNW